MRPGSIKLQFRPSMSFNQTLEMIENHFLELRAKAIMREVTHMAAEMMLEEVQSKIPTGSQYTSYRDALHVVQSGAPSNPAFSVYAEATKAEQVQKDKDILYIKPAKKKGKIAPEVAILMKYQPWTQDTLPFTVQPKQGKLVIRTVSAREVTAVAKARAADQPKWSRELAEVGVQPDPAKAKVPENAKGLPDLAYTALRLEFGLGGTKAVAHWRPALQTVQQRVASVFKSGKFADALLNWDNDEWRSWKNLSAPLVSSSTVADFQGFEDKVS